MGVAEIVLNVDDLPAMKNFYCSVLGFLPLSEGSYEDPPNPSGPPTIVFLQVQATDTPLGKNGHPVLLALIDYRRHAFAKAKFESLQISHSTLNHLAFEIPPESYQNHLRRLKQLKLAPVETSFPNMQAKAIFFKDVEGNSLELICHDGEIDQTMS